MAQMLATSNSMEHLIAMALHLGARNVPGWTLEEERLCQRLPTIKQVLQGETANAINLGNDPLGDWFCRCRSSEERRPKGAIYTPQIIVEAMLNWAVRQTEPARIVDLGSGSGRFLVAAGRRFPTAELVASEIDPFASIATRGHLAAAGMANRSRVEFGDFRSLLLKKVDGPTLFLGNPPYVRHHLISPRWKQWLIDTAREYDFKASRRSGLHVHFVLATAVHGQPGDVGILITAAEWLDVNYGRLLRELFVDTLGIESIHLVEPTAKPFAGTQTTAVITGFRFGTKSETVGMRRVAALDDLGSLETLATVTREQLKSADRWTPLTRASRQRRAEFIELGEVCRVHRGQATGANDVWITRGNPFQLPKTVLFPAVTKARELIISAGVLTDSSKLQHVIDLPQDLSIFDKFTLERIEHFLDFARSRGTENGYLARHRKSWWSVGLRHPAPILATYMARRPPAFVRNVANARHINIAHGLYPRVELDQLQLTTLSSFLSTSVDAFDGRTYAGGLTKFEPREMERLLIPHPNHLANPKALYEMI